MATTTFLRNNNVRCEADDPQPFGEFDAVRAALFGVMHAVAGPWVQHFQSDFYRDTQWLIENVHGPVKFWYGAHEHGTAAAFELEHLRAFFDRIWEIELTVSDGGRWEAHVKEVSHEPA